MATINSVPKSIHLPLSGLSTTPRVLMCSASVGTEGSVTLQLRDANSTSSFSPSSSSDSNHSLTAARIASHTDETSLENALTIGYPDPEMLADVLGTLQTAALKNTNINFFNSGNVNKNNNNNNNNINKQITTTNATTTIQLSETDKRDNNPNPTTNPNNDSNPNNNQHYQIVNVSDTGNGSKNCPNNIKNRLTTSTSTSTTATNRRNNIVTTANVSSGNYQASNREATKPSNILATTTVQTVSTSTNTTNKTNSYIKNCLIRSSSYSNTANITSLAQIMSNSNTTSTSIGPINNNTNNNNNNNNSNNNNINNSNCSNSSSSANGNNGTPQPLQSSNPLTCNNSNCSSTSNFSSNSNDSCFSVNSNSNSSSGNISVRSVSVHGNRKVPGALANPPKIFKKSRSKLSSPSRHGPQQCQICNKIFGNASALAKHKLTHSDERKYVCAMCSKAFKRQDHLNGHMMTHRNKKPYECKAEGCGKSYCDARSLRRHTENHHAGIITPQNQSLNSVAAINGRSSASLSLSPATASGDANSPDGGATCLGTYISNGGTVVDASTGLALTEEELKALNVPLKTEVTLLSPTSTTATVLSTGGRTTSPASTTITLTDNGGNSDGEGLTREQLDLISKIMRQTKQTTAQVTVSSHSSSQSYKIDTSSIQTQTQNSRPRTWNMQLLNTTQNLAITVDEVTNDITSQKVGVIHTDVNDADVKIDLTGGVTSTNMLNIVKVDQKPVECNLCHRKFKNTPALNGHMRLHGGYFKKDPDSKKSEKKENNGPPLQTASFGVRALIEEKIISKRSRDLNKGAFAVPAPPTSNLSNNPSLRRSVNDLESFINSKTQANLTTSTLTNTTGTMLPANVTIKNSSRTLLNAQDMGLPQSIEIFSTKQSKHSINNVSVGVGTSPPQTTTATERNISTNGPKTSTTAISATAAATSTATMNTITTTTTRSTSTDTKDSTLIELLKRGTRIAITSKQPSNAPLGGVSRPIVTNNSINNNNQRPLITSSEVQVLNNNKTKLSNANFTASNGISITEAAPLSLAISQNASNASEIFTVTYAGDNSNLFGDGEVFNVNEAEMLLQTVDTMQLLNDSGQDNLLKLSEPSDRLVMTENSVRLGEGFSNTLNGQHRQILPNFQQFHSKDLTNNCINPSINGRLNSLSIPLNVKSQYGSLNSPPHSPLAYPTPPSSHENVTQTSPYIEDNQHFSDSANVFFSETLITPSTSGCSELDSDNIMKLKSVLEDNNFDNHIKVEDLLNDANPDTECDLREFAEANLSFLDEDQDQFLNDSDNATSPLTESFFNADIGSAEEVKEVLHEVLSDNQMSLQCENQSENIIDLYYLPGLSLQSQMMPNSEDPLLSSSPRDFGQQKMNHQTSGISSIPPQSPNIVTNGSSNVYHSNNAVPLHALQQQQQPPQNIVQFAINQQQQQQQEQQHTSTDSSQVIVTVPDNECAGAASFMQYNLPNLPQVQIHQNQQQSQQQQYIDTKNLPPTMTATATNCSGGGSNNNRSTMATLNEALMQPLIYTGTTERLDMKLELTQNRHLGLNIQPQQQQQQQPQQQPLRGTDYKLQIHSNLNSVASNNQPTATYNSNANNHSTPNTMSVITTTLQPLSNQTNSILKRRLKGYNSSDVTSTSSHSKFQVLSPYRSKLRKPSRTHYTPAPILNPERKGQGLYYNILKDKCSSLLGFDTFNDDFDDAVGLVDFSDESKVNLGSAYQASLPALRERTLRTGVEEPVGAELMWDPEVQKDEKILLRFIDLIKSSAVPLGCHTEEVALQTLMISKGNTSSAVLTLLQTQSNSFQMTWTALELETFLKGLEKYGKEFCKISKELGSKTTGECVQMYYFWKKLCVDYKISHLKTETPPNNHVSEAKPYVCEQPDCSASFSSKAALHGHTRIHTYGRNSHNHSATNSNANITTLPGSTSAPAGACNANTQASHSASLPKDSNATTSKDNSDFPCKVCGKVFNKIKSRSAHMKTHRVADNDTATTTTATTTAIVQSVQIMNQIQIHQPQQLQQLQQQQQQQQHQQQQQQPPAIRQEHNNNS